MAKCEVCKTKQPVRGAIVADYYYQRICRGCYAELLHNTKVSSGHAEYARGRDHEEHSQDIIQPWNGDGKPSAEFSKLYPNQARTMFGDDGMRTAERA